MNKETKHILKLGTFIIVAVGVLGFMFWYVNKYLYPFFATTNAVTVTMSPEKTQKQLQEEFNVTLGLSGQYMSGVELYFNYDGDKLEYVMDQIVVLPDKYFTDVVIEKVKGELSNNQNQLLVTLVTLSEISGDTVNINLKFKAISAGTAKITLDSMSKVVGVDKATKQSVLYFDLSPTTVSSEITIGSVDTTITPSVTITPEVTDGVTITPGVTDGVTITPSISITEIPTPPISGDSEVKLNLKLRFQGITSQPKEGGRTMDVAVAVAPVPYVYLAREKIATFTAQSDGTWTGSVTFENVPSYFAGTIYIKGPKHIKKKICSNSPKEPVAGGYRCSAFELLNLKNGENNLDFSNVILLAGDLPIQNGVVDAVDLAFIRQTLSNQDAEKLQRGDLNLDGIIDTQDFSLVLSALGFKYDEE